jgi:hypothetical protein
MVYLYDSIAYVSGTGFHSAFWHSPRPVRCLFHDSPRSLPSRIPFACFRPVFRQKSGEQKSAQPRESCQALQNEHLQKSSHNSREMNTYKIIGLKVEQNEHLQKKRGGPLDPRL